MDIVKKEKKRKEKRKECPSFWMATMHITCHHINDDDDILFSFVSKKENFNIFLSHCPKIILYVYCHYYYCIGLSHSLSIYIRNRFDFKFNFWSSIYLCNEYFHNLFVGLVWFLEFFIRFCVRMREIEL